MDGDLNSAPNPSRHTFVPVHHVASERTDWVMNFVPTSSLSSKLSSKWFKVQNRNKRERERERERVFKKYLDTSKDENVAILV